MDDRHDSEPASQARFATTSWTLVRAVLASPGAVGQAACNEWVKRYWKPVYAYFRSRGQTPEQSADLTQEFLHELLAEGKLRTVRPGTSFRHWLRECAYNFLVQTLRYDAAKKRRPPGGWVSLDD